MHQIGTNLKTIRERKDLTIRDVNKKTKIATGTISNYERSKSVPNIENLMKLAKAYDVTTDEILGMYNIDKKNTYEIGLDSETIAKLCSLKKETYTKDDIVEIDKPSLKFFNLFIKNIKPEELEKIYKLIFYPHIYNKNFDSSYFFNNPFFYEEITSKKLSLDTRNVFESVMKRIRLSKEIAICIMNIENDRIKNIFMRENKIKKEEEWRDTMQLENTIANFHEDSNPKTPEEWEEYNKASKEGWEEYKKYLEYEADKEKQHVEKLKQTKLDERKKALNSIKK